MGIYNGEPQSHTDADMVSYLSKRLLHFILQFFLDNDIQGESANRFIDGAYVQQARPQSPGESPTVFEQ